MPDNHHLAILLIEDSPTTSQIVRHWLGKGLTTPFTFRSAATLAEGLLSLRDEKTDVIVLDLNLPDSEGLDTFRAVHARAHEIPIVIMSSERDEELAVAAVREGAQDYVVKGSYRENPLARPLRFAVERAGRRQAEQELAITREQVGLARAVQQQLYPAAGPVVEGFDIAGRCEPAESAGGDYFDFFPLVDDHWAVAIGDVSGHGLSAALFMVEVRSVLRTLATSYHDVGFIIGRANQVLGPDLSEGRFVTLTLLNINPTTGTLRFSTAGDCAYVLGKSGDVKQELETDFPPIGVVPDLEYPNSPEIVIEPGELVLLFTDGISEWSNAAGELFGRERVLEAVKTHRHRPAKEIVDEVFAAGQRFAQGAPQSDDIAVIVVKSG